MEHIKNMTEEQKKALLELDKSMINMLNDRFTIVKGWYSITTIATLIVGLLPPVWFLLFIPGFLSFSSSLKLGWLKKSMKEVKKEIQFLENELAV